MSPRSLVRRVVSLHLAEYDELRRRAFEQLHPVTEFVEEAIRRYLQVGD